MAETQVALRSESAPMIEQVRSVLAVAGMPVAVYPEHAPPPVSVGLALDGGEVAATSECVVVLVSTATGRPMPLPEDFREHLLTLSGPAVPLRPRLTTLD